MVWNCGDTARSLWFLSDISRLLCRSMAYMTTAARATVAAPRTACRTLLPAPRPLPSATTVRSFFCLRLLHVLPTLPTLPLLSHTFQTFAVAVTHFAADVAMLCISSITTLYCAYLRGCGAFYHGYCSCLR